MFEKLTQIEDPTIFYQLRFRPLTIGLEVTGAAAQTLHLAETGISLADGLDEACDFVLQATPQAWTEYSQATPKVGFQSINALLETDNMDISGPDMVLFARYTMLIEKLFETLRPAGKTHRAPIDAPFVEPITGRYLNLNIAGERNRIYVEEAGQGQPVLCLHTAGSDGRQYRGLMQDTELTETHRIIAFDLPGHGKSSPLPGWENRPYMLTTDYYMEAVMAVSQALQLDNPVVMGCSIGGRAVLHLALRHGDHFKAAIGLQSAMHAESHLNEKLGLLDEGILHRPDIHGGEVAAASMRQIMSPHAPSQEYWETMWYYAQGGPGIFMGDLYYYFVDGDLRNGLAAEIDTEKCPLYLLTGEYDLSATPAMTEELAATVKAQHCEVMKGLGHFPMSEDPARFLTYLKPVLGKIAAQA